ncbi:MAG TPA: hypothetical protein VKA30_10870 [Actinomycetota bacterium]|nr:hypothetical protein [Actinomycetota bacterium]
MDEQLEYGFGTAVYVLDHTADKLSAEDADSGFGEVTKENFWRMWPDIKTWADDLWRRLDDERRNQARPVEDDLADDVGGGG